MNVMRAIQVFSAPVIATLQFFRENSFAHPQGHSFRDAGDTICFMSNYLLENGFHYVLTRRLSSDPVESLFSALRQMNGGNDGSDAKASTVAINKILRTGLLLPHHSSNVPRKRCQPENHFSTDEEEDLDKSQIQEIEPKKSTKKKKLVKLNDIRSKKPKKLQKNSYAWKKGDKLDPIPSEKAQILEETHPELASKTPYELFRMYFDSDIMNLILEETLRYAAQKNNTTFSLSEKLLEVFLGIILFSGYHSLPQEDLYWSNSEDCNLPFIQNAMSRQRFRDIKKFLHLCDNNSIDGSDKLAKVRCFIEMFCKKLQQFGTFAECLSVDEEMIPYTGRHSAKMYMRNKPIKFGYKLWILASSQGYPFNIQVYVGKEAAGPPTKFLLEREWFWI
ncbi:hypothetical protein JTE90_006627 [Oedothorax gibbosus]|uniref:PiggyBac transposable element-derived protein domain-containing protein n=1 Tax=Oedothorax gibbosus TaxID=931172 RepID=A0AAV6U609_9ARAC|nr:hypothetical protein JTE90_006627 [Oedothorax gibbosus]